MLGLIIAVSTLSPLPPVCVGDLALFPPKDYTRDQWDIAREAKWFFETRATIYPHIDYSRVTQSQKWRERVWDALDYAHYTHMSVESRQRWLSTLRDLIGAEAYYAGRMPEPLAISPASRLIP